jgi:hypothetical protein
MRKGKSTNFEENKSFLFFEQHVPKTKNNILSDWIFFGLVIFSLIATVYGITLYRNTVISPIILFGIVSIGFILIFLGFWIFLGKKLSLISILFSGLVIGGGISYTSFLFVNKSFPTTPVKSFTYSIQNTGELAKGRYGRCNSPYVVISIHGNKKQLVFPCDERNESQNAKKVVLDIYEGFLGFPFISRKELK